MGPNEIHIYDPKFYHQLYSLNTAFYKDPAVHKVLGAPSSTVAETDPVKHKRRRRPLESLFSRQSILELEPMVMSKIEFCCQRFDEIESNGRLIKVEGALKSLTIDIVSHFGLGRSLGALEHEDFWSSHVQVFQTYLHSIHIIKAFPFVRTLSVGLPLWLARRLSGTVAMGKELEIVRQPLTCMKKASTLTMASSPADMSTTSSPRIPRARNRHFRQSWSGFSRRYPPRASQSRPARASVTKFSLSFPPATTPPR